MDWEDHHRKFRMFWQIVECKSGQRIRKALRNIFARDPFYGDFRRYEFSFGKDRASRVALVNHFIHLNDYRAYLEIGVRKRSAMFEKVRCERRVSVDPDPQAEADYCMTSDSYFASCSENFDIVFIDGNHTGEQVLRDLTNSLAHLRPGGVILLHDMNPPTRFHARRDYEVNGSFPPWNGTSWKGYAALRQTRPDVSMCVVNTDWGVGVVHPGRQQRYLGPCDTYDHLLADRKRILNLISVSEFLRRYARPFGKANQSKGR